MDMHEIYSHNWYNRNTETYVFGPATSIGTTYTSMIYTRNQVDVFLSDYKKLSTELQDIIKNRFNIKVNIKISDTSEDTYTDGKNIVIVSQKDIADPFTRLDIIFGMCFHELAHCIFTKFSECKKKNMHLNLLLKHIHNILEDEEIENRIVKKNMGYGKYIAKVKYHILAKNGCGKNAVTAEKKNNLDTILTILFCIVRYPKYLSLIDTEILDKYVDLFIKINNILTNCKCPAINPFGCEALTETETNKTEITPTTVSATFEIYKYLQQYLGEDFENEKTECEEAEDSFMNKMGAFMPTGASEKNPNDINNAIDSEFGIPMPHDDIYEGSDNGDNVSTQIDRVRFGNPTRYNKFAHDMYKYMDGIEKAVIPNSTKTKDVLEIRRFRRNGNLDTTRLADAMQNINTIYNQRFTTQKRIDNAEAKYAFVIMMDESGSMQTRDKREEFSVKTAILFYEVLSKFKGIELYIYGHGDKINPYITKERRDKFALGNFDKQGGQNDAYSYNWIINDVKRQTNLPIVVLNITDFYYHSNDTALINVLNGFKKSNVSFNMLTLGTHLSNREIATCKRILEGQYTVLENINDVNLVRNAFNEIAVMIADNYKRFNKR